MSVKIGEPAPDFVLTDTKGNQWRLSDQLGNVTALLFYPQNETLVCTKQLCSVRDNWKKYLETKATIVGISPATPEAHQNFAEKYHLPMPLLADQGRIVTKIYNQHQWYPVWLLRSIVVIDAKGIIRTHRINIRAFRPTDYQILSAIYAARSDLLHDKYNALLSRRK